MSEEIKRLQFGLLKASNIILNSHRKEEFNKVIKIIGEAARLDHVYICKHHKDDEPEEIYFSILLEWFYDSDQIKNDTTQSQKISYSRFSLLKLYENLSTGNTQKFILSNLSEDLKRCFIDKRIKSIIFVPMMVKGEYWGFLGFEEFKYDRKWTDEEIKIFAEFAKLLSNSLEKRNGDKSFYIEKYNQTLKLVNEESILSIFEEEKPGADFFIDLFDILLKDIPSVSMEIETAVKNKDSENLKFYSHKLGGTLIILGAKSALDISIQLEDFARGKIIDEKTRKFNTKLQEDLNQIIIEIKALREKYLNLFEN